jgi:hypothetical protein
VEKHATLLITAPALTSASVIYGIMRVLAALPLADAPPPLSLTATTLTAFLRQGLARESALLQSLREELTIIVKRLLAVEQWDRETAPEASEAALGLVILIMNV